MRSCKSIVTVGLLSLLLSGCIEHHASASLSVCNESGDDLWVESYIVSPYCDSTKAFLLREGMSEVVALSEVQESENYADLRLQSCVFNEDAYVIAYKVNSLGEKELVHTWRYVDRNSGGHELFNEACIEKIIHSNAAGDVVVSYPFTISPEDITGIMEK